MYSEFPANLSLGNVEITLYIAEVTSCLIYLIFRSGIQEHL